jgi:hypothetical protein
MVVACIALTLKFFIYCLTDSVHQRLLSLASGRLVQRVLGGPVHSKSEGIIT